MKGRPSRQRDVLVISQLPPPIHGSTVMTRTLLESLHRLGYSSQLVDRRFSRTVGSVGKFSTRKLLSAFWMPARLAKALVTTRPRTVIFFTTNRTMSFLVDVALGFLLRLSPARKIFYVHTLGYRALAHRNAAFGWLVQCLFRSANHVVCLSPSLGQDVSEFVDPTRITYIPNTIQDSPIAEIDYETERSQLLYFSNLVPEKGAADFVASAEILAALHDGVSFKVAGASVDDSFTTSLHEHVHAAGLENRIAFTGAVTSPEEKWSILAESIALVFPSTYKFEAQPLAVIEALAAGTPVLAFDTGALRDMVLDAHNGYVCPQNQEALTARIDEVLRDPSLQRKLRAGARQTFVANYSRQAFERNWGSLLSGNATPPPPLDGP